MIDSEQNSVSGPGLTCSMLDWIRLKARDNPSAKRLPSSVGFVPCALRLSNGNSSESSSMRMCRLTAPCVTDNSSAAALKLCSRAVALKARNAFNDWQGKAIWRLLKIGLDWVYPEVM